jgi:hypothetical protein
MSWWGARLKVLLDERFQIGAANADQSSSRTEANGRQDLILDPGKDELFADAEDGGRLGDGVKVERVRSRWTCVLLAGHDLCSLSLYGWQNHGFCDWKRKLLRGGAASLSVEQRRKEPKEQTFLGLSRRTAEQARRRFLL